MTIKKLIEDKKIQLLDMLVMATSWTHKLSRNKSGYSPMELATGNAVMIFGLTMVNVATESMIDAEAVKKIMENLTRTIVEFREVDMKKKLKECQRLSVMSYQHREPYKEGYKVWYQNRDGKAWYEPAIVHYQKGSSVLIYFMGEIKRWQHAW